MTAFIVFAASFQYPLLNLDHLYTPLLAVFSIGLIVLGIVLKSRPYRYVAMLSFLVPIYRLFAYDIGETLSILRPQSNHCLCCMHPLLCPIRKLLTIVACSISKVFIQESNKRIRY